MAYHTGKRIGPKYKWKTIPEHLKTLAKLREEGLKPASGVEPVAYVQGGLGSYDLYDIAQTVKVKASPAQLAALEKVRAKVGLAARTCPVCHQVQDYKTDISPGEWGGGMMCIDCENKMANQFFDDAYNDQVKWARALLLRDDWLILDTETTDLYGYTVEIGVIKPDGTTAFHSLVNPQWEIDPGAQSVHGISPAEVASAPTFASLEPKLRECLEGRTIVVYNAAFDSGIFDNEFDRIGGAPWSDSLTWNCAMESYARFVGEWNSRYRSFKWQRLNGGHRALGDCLACLALIRTMAESPLRGEDAQGENA